VSPARGEAPPRGPLHGVRVIELAGIGPSPFSAMLLADMGADVLRIERPGYQSPANPVRPERDVLNRGRRSVAIDLKSPRGVELVLALVASADVLVEGFRPGVTERLGVGPESCLQVNPGLVYGRMTGWGQTGPLRDRAGHDINYISVAGALSAIGTADRPVIPLNLVGDFGGGGMLMALGVLAALVHARSSGTGQVVDASVVDGTALLSSIFFGFMADGLMDAPRGGNLLDGGCHYYQAYQCRDGSWISVGAIEPQFYDAFLAGLGLDQDAEFLAGHSDRSLWPLLRDRAAAVIARRDQAEWLAVFEGTDACVSEVVEMRDLAAHPHNKERGVLIDVDGVEQPAPAPRFSATPLPTPSRPPLNGEHTSAALTDWGIHSDLIGALLSQGVLTQRP